jgi:catechol 2,3-dioxygenase-like lactoylglutathione lyase family enzyme
VVSSILARLCGLCNGLAQKREGGKTMDTGSPPREGFAAMAIELIVSNYEKSLAFWAGPLGFDVCYTRPAQRFAYLERAEGAQMMFYERDSDCETGPLEAHYVRGANIQLTVTDVDEVYHSVRAAKIPFFVDLREKWRDWGDRQGGQREFLVQDPDGYLVMVNQKLGEHV